MIGQFEDRPMFYNIWAHSADQSLLINGPIDEQLHILKALF